MLRLLPACAGLALVGYFGFHAAWGERGLLSLRQLQGDITERRVALDGLEAERTVLSRRVSLLSGSAIDGDILDEQVRRRFGWSQADEIVILNDGATDDR